MLSVTSQSSTTTQSKEIDFPVPWGRITAKSWGNPAGKPVLAVHGWLDNAGSFDKLAPLLSKDLYVVAIDWPGHGKSSHRPKGVHYDAYNYIADIKYVIDALNWKKFTFLAHSMGGGAASWFAGALPDRVEALLLIESYGFLTEPMKDLPKLMGHSLNNLVSLKDDGDSKVYPTLDAAIDRMIEGHIRLDNDFNREAAIALCNRGVEKVVTGGYKFTRDLQAKAPSLLKVAHEMDAVFLRAIQCPVLVILGGSTFLSSLIRKKLANTADHQKVKVVTVPGSHHVHLVRPEGMYKLADHFLLCNEIHPDFHDRSKL